MSWFPLTILLIIAGFACAYGVSEWVAWRIRRRSGGDRGSPTG